MRYINLRSSCYRWWLYYTVIRMPLSVATRASWIAPMTPWLHSWDNTYNGKVILIRFSIKLFIMCGALVERATTHTHTVEQVMVCATDAVRHDCNHDFAYNRTASHSYAQSIRYHGSILALRLWTFKDCSSLLPLIINYDGRRHRIWDGNEWMMNSLLWL